MSATASLTVSPASPNHGDTVTATYATSGNDPIPPVTGSVSGDATVGTQVIHVSTSLTLPGTPAQPEQFAVPTYAGLTFAGTSNPKVFTALVP